MNKNIKILLTLLFFFEATIIQSTKTNSRNTYEKQDYKINKYREIGNYLLGTLGLCAGVYSLYQLYFPKVESYTLNILGLNVLELRLRKNRAPFLVDWFKRKENELLIQKQPLIN